MDGFQKVGQVEDVPPGQSKIVKVNDRPIALFNIDGQFYAIHNSCPHEGGPLIEGRLKGYVIACPCTILPSISETDKGRMGVAIV